LHHLLTRGRCANTTSCQLSRVNPPPSPRAAQINTLLGIGETGDPGAATPGDGGGSNGGGSSGGDREKVGPSQEARLA